MAALTKDQILAAADVALTELSIPEWGGSVFIKPMTGTERDAFEQSIIDAREKKNGLVNIRARLAVKTIVDAVGTRIFADGDADALGAKSGKALDRAFDLAQKLCGISKDDEVELTKNL